MLTNQGIQDVWRSWIWTNGGAGESYHREQHQAFEKGKCFVLSVGKIEAHKVEELLWLIRIPRDEEHMCERCDFMFFKWKWNVIHGFDSFFFTRRIYNFAGVAVVAVAACS